MKAFVVALAVAFGAAAAFPDIAEARRIGGGGAAGMQRSLPPRATPDSVPARPAAPTAQSPSPAAAAAPGAAAAAGKRSWMGPIAGLAAGLGLAALFSHLGLGAELANFMMIALLVIAGIFLVRFLMRRFMPANANANARAGNGMQFAGAGAGAPRIPQPPTSFPDERPEHLRGTLGGSSAAASAPAMAVAAPANIPAGFDAAGFERIAKMIFIRMQTANDSGDLADLRAFTTPEMFAAIKLDLQERGNAAQRTDVVRVDAEVLDVAEETDRQIVSVRFHGLIREESDGVAEPFDEVWHLVKPADGSREWAIAGIQQTATAQPQPA
jgi:predicted lipid-binding transport protein (Tim44 family)